MLSDDSNPKEAQQKAYRYLGKTAKLYPTQSANTTLGNLSSLDSTLSCIYAATQSSTVIHFRTLGTGITTMNSYNCSITRLA